MIPKTLHIIWVGDETRRPDNCIDSWRTHNPGWTVRIWGNAELTGREWANGDHMRAMAQRELNGVADMMRWEILFAEGGLVVDADSLCIRPLDDDLLDCEAFACWESEIQRPGLIAAGYFGSVAQNPFVGQIILDIRNEPSVVDRPAWQSVGPQRLTDAYRAYRYQALTIYPSHYFIPEHFSGLCYEGTGRVYARQLWGSTNGTYDRIYLEDFTAVPDSGPTPAIAQPAAAPAPSAAPGRDTSVLEERHQSYFVQKVQVSQELIGVSRLDAFRVICEGKRVLHFGCADWPITDVDASLHLALKPFCALLDGFDIHEDALAALAPHCNGRLFSNVDQIEDDYDIILVPEVMEHVAGVENFLATLSTVNSSMILLSVPDAYQCRDRHFDYLESSETFVEVVHPDHNCWYTPYTLTNTLAKYTDWNMERMWFFNGISLLALLTRPPRALLAADTVRQAA